MDIVGESPVMTILSEAELRKSFGVSKSVPLKVAIDQRKIFNIWPGNLVAIGAEKDAIEGIPYEDFCAVLVCKKHTAVCDASFCSDDRILTDGKTHVLISNPTIEYQGEETSFDWVILGE